jgi:hypothetical protein
MISFPNFITVFLLDYGGLNMAYTKNFIKYQRFAQRTI